MASAFRSAFRNYFLAMQSLCGLSLSIRAGIEGGFLWAIGGFFSALPITLPIAVMQAWAFTRNPLFFEQRVRWLRTLATGLVTAIVVVACMIGLDLYLG